jgi:hypothetical protein
MLRNRVIDWISDVEVRNGIVADNATGPNQVWAMDWSMTNCPMGAVSGFSPSLTLGAECVR